MKIAQIINADSWGDISPASFEKGIGGREGALIKLATEWAKLGHEVTNFVPTKNPQRFTEKHRVIPAGVCVDGDPHIYGFHEYVPYTLAKPMLASFPYDAVVAWECPSIYASDLIVEKQKVRLVHMQVAHLIESEMDAAAEYATGLVALSPWARDFLVHDGLTLDSSKLHVRPNGVSIQDYPLVKGLKKGHNFVYSSSPDRGLIHVLRIWPEIMKRYRDAKLFVAYGVEKFIYNNMWYHNKVGGMCIEIAEKIHQPGVIDVGQIGHKELSELQRSAVAWLYPCDTIQATETGCITAVENMAAGNPCFITDADCLGSEFGDVAEVLPLPFNPDQFLERLFYTLDDLSYYTFLQMNGLQFAKNRDWGVIAPTWIDLFKEQNGSQ